MEKSLNVASAPRTSAFQMRINPEIKEELEAVYAKNGMSLTDAINVFFQQSLNAGGLPFLASPENADFMRQKAVKRLMAELQKGLDSAREYGCISADDVERMLEEKA